MTGIGFLPEKCVGCGACMVACMDQNDIDVSAGQRSFCQVRRQERDGRSVYSSAICRHCPDALCAEVCPGGCLYRDTGTGLILYDGGACVGCGACAGVCPFGAIRPAGEPVRMEKCGGCRPRVEAGLPPACVRACPFGALTWSSPRD